MVKFNQFKDRDYVLRNGKNLKGCNIYANDDVSEKVREKRKALLPKLKEARANGKIAHFVHDNLVIKDRIQPEGGKPTEPRGRPQTRSVSTALPDPS